jgi:glycosyltransferase involved in cell wall biosynthesis
MHANRVLMLLSNAYDPDPRVRQEAVSLLGMGCDIRILAWDRDLKAAARQSMDGVDVERVFVPSTHGRGITQVFRYALVYWKFLWRGLRTPFDVVHCHDLDTLPIGVVLGTLKRKPVVYDAHESFADMLAGSVPRIAQRVLAAFEGVLMRRSALVITVGEKLRRYLESRGARHSVVVGNWKRVGDFVRTPAQNQELRRRLGVPDGALFVVCVTQLRPDRKLEELLGAAAVCPDAYVLIAGSGGLEARVREAAAANPRIIYTGFVSGRTIADYTCAADAIYYGFDPDNPNARFSAPNKLYEALAAGRPLITGDFGEIADVVREAGCGIVLPEYSIDEVRRALMTLSDTGLRATMAANAARAGRTSFNWETGEEVLYREYSALMPGLHKPARAMSAELAAAGVGQS